MNADIFRDSYNLLTKSVIGAAMSVSNEMGCGFLEKVYENALALELRSRGHDVEQQKAIAVRYRKEIVGEYLADLLVDGRLVVELKAVQTLNRIHSAQCLNYLRAIGLPLALLLNFGRPRLEFHRIVCNL
jgi:GxxExxY protein